MIESNTVYFVGSGPGDPELITIKAKKLLENADVIVYSGSLLNPKLLEYAKKDAVLHDAALLDRNRIYEVLRDSTKQGKLAIRFHGHETLTEIVGTGGRLTVGHNPRRNRVDIADGHGVRNECTPTFYERFEDAFVNECAEFVAAIRDDRAPALTLRDATEATRIGRMLAESHRTGKAVESR